MAKAKPKFDYSNLADRPAGRFIRIGSKLVPGIRKVQAQVVPYATAWGQANSAALEQDSPLWVALGDSMSQGVGASTYDRGWVGQLHTMLQQAGKDYRLVNLSMTGARVADVLERQLPALHELGTMPDLVTIMIGSNDMVSKKHRRNLVENYQKLLEQLPPKTVLVSPFGNFSTGAAVNKLIEEQAAHYGITLVDNQLGTGLASWKGKLAADHFHPNDLGYQGLAELVYKKITLTPLPALE